MKLTVEWHVYKSFQENGCVQNLKILKANQPLGWLGGESLEDSPNETRRKTYS
jgi:hypothetical protein